MNDPSFAISSFHQTAPPFLLHKNWGAVCLHSELSKLNHSPLPAFFADLICTFCRFFAKLCWIIQKIFAILFCKNFLRVGRRRSEMSFCLCFFHLKKHSIPFLLSFSFCPFWNCLWNLKTTMSNMVGCFLTRPRAF